MAGCGLAVASARAMSFDCALIDYHLPDGDGHALSRELKRLLPAMRIVLMSADRAAPVYTLLRRLDPSLSRAFCERLRNTPISFAACRSPLRSATSMPCPRTSTASE